MNSVNSSGPDLYAQICHRIRKAMGEFNDDNVSIELLVTALAEKNREYAAHLARQSEWVSEEDLKIACRAYNKAMGIPAVPSGFATPHLMRAALTAVWYNRPKQEKSEPVAWLADDGTGRVIDAKAKSAGSRAAATGAATAVYSIPLYTAPPAERVQEKAEPVEMSPEFTDSARGAIAWVLYHHQGGSSPIGQPLRFALGMGAHEPLSADRIADAKRYAAWAGATTEQFHRPPAERVRVPKSLVALVEACEEEFCCPGTEKSEPDESKVSYPEDKCHITFGHIRRARKALSAAPEASSHEQSK